MATSIIAHGVTYVSGREQFPRDPGAMKAALKPPVAEGGPAVRGGGNRRDWFHGVGGRRVTFIATRGSREFGGLDWIKRPQGP